MGSRRDRLSSRPRPQAIVKLRLDTSQEFLNKERELEAIEIELTRAPNQKLDDNIIETLEARKAVLKEELSPGYDIVVINALRPDQMEALIAEHPSGEEGFSFNRDTFFPALLAACVEGDDSAEDWASIITDGTLVLGEVNSLLAAAMEVNDRSPDVTLGKGLTPILN